MTPRLQAVTLVWISLCDAARIVSDLLAHLPIQADEECTVPLMYGSGMKTNGTEPAPLDSSRFLCSSCRMLYEIVQHLMARPSIIGLNVKARHSPS